METLKAFPCQLLAILLLYLASASLTLGEQAERHVSYRSCHVCLLITCILFACSIVVAKRTYNASQLQRAGGPGSRLELSEVLAVQGTASSGQGADLQMKPPWKAGCFLS